MPFVYIKMLTYLIVIYGLWSIIPVSECMRNNVCKTLADYRTIQNNPNCWYNPDVGASPEQIAKRYGYPFETYKVTSEDGYILTLFRIPHNGTDVNGKRTPILLQHGILADASTWFEMGLKSSVFFFSNNGYDVWVINARGTFYSSDHVKYTVFDPIYWNFSFHEMAVIDLPAVLEFITLTTEQKSKIVYVGHSMGTTISYVYASVKPEHASKHLKTIVSLAPIAYLWNVRSLPRLLALFRNEIWEFFKSIGLYGIGTNIQHKFDLVHRLCREFPFIIICTQVFSLGSGINKEEEDESLLPVAFSALPSGFSLKTVLHYGQIIVSRNRFQFFDYGSKLNLELYNMSVPPEYPLSRIKIPVYLFYGKSDPLSVEKDVFHLYNTLETEKSIMEVFGFTHLNFLSSRHAPKFYQVLLMYLRKKNV